VSLADWQKNGWLKAHQTNRNEIAELMAIVDRDLAASKTPGLHNDWSFNIAYNAALQLATAALAASGYQAERANHHYRVIDSLGFTIGIDAGTRSRSSTSSAKSGTFQTMNDPLESPNVRLKRYDYLPKS
jgi:hypothetical protein